MPLLVVSLSILSQHQIDQEPIPSLSKCKVSHDQVHEVASILSATCCPWCWCRCVVYQSVASIQASSSICERLLSSNRLRAPPINPTLNVPYPSPWSNLHLICNMPPTKSIKGASLHLPHHPCTTYGHRPVGHHFHRDLKPNNVLLGEDMTAYVIDFGIATIYFANKEDSTFTSTLALKGSMGYVPLGIIWTRWHFRQYYEFHIFIKYFEL